MTKKELIKHIEKYPDDTIIVIEGYEDGYDDPVIQELDILYMANYDRESGIKETPYIGLHGRIDYTLAEQSEVKKAIVLLREMTK